MRRLSPRFALGILALTLYPPLYLHPQSGQPAQPNGKGQAASKTDLLTQAKNTAAKRNHSHNRALTAEEVIPQPPSAQSQMRAAQQNEQRRRDEQLLKQQSDSQRNHPDHPTSN